VLCHVINPIASEYNISTGVSQGVDHFFELRLFLIEELLKLLGVGYIDFGINLSFSDFKCPIKERHVRVFDHIWHVLVDAFFIDNDSFDEFRILDRSTDHFLN
jgi:hypothetical protein